MVQTPSDTEPIVPEAEGPRRWPWWLGLAGLGIAFVGASLLAFLAIGVGAIFGASASDPPSSVQIVSVLLQDICFLGFPVMLAASFGGTWRPWMFGYRRVGLKSAVIWIVAGYAALLLFSLVWSQFVHVDEKNGIVDDLGVRTSTVALLAGAFIITVMAPIAEETLFRGFIFPSLRNLLGVVWAAVVTGVIFGGIHVAGSPVGALLPLALFGGILCVVYLKTKSLLPCMALHCVNNVIAYGSLVDWTWQIPVCLVVSLSIILVAYRLVESSTGQGISVPEPV